MGIIYDARQKQKLKLMGFPVLGTREDIAHLTTEILDVKDRERVELVFRRFRPGVVFHAAAHKHVPLMERNPEEASKNNILGTYNVAVISDLTRVKTFVLISTDKAINPTSIMGPPNEWPR